MLQGLADIGVYGVSFHDDDMMSFGAPEAQRRAELETFKQLLDKTGLVCSMATTNLFYHPVFKDGAFTSNDPQVRKYAIQKSLRNIDVAAELGALNEKTKVAEAKRPDRPTGKYTLEGLGQRQADRAAKTIVLGQQLGRVAQLAGALVEQAAQHALAGLQLGTE